jgi:hypothetical protein
MTHAPGAATAGNGGSFDPQQAADLLDQATRQARRQFTPGSSAAAWSGHDHRRAA